MMNRESRFKLYSGLGMAVSLAALLAAGCAKPDEAASGASGRPSSAGPMGGPGGQMGGPGRMGGGPGGPGGGGGKGGPVAENASGAEILQAKCGCHGAGGAGGRAPNLTELHDRSVDDLSKIIHDGKEKMPGFASQLSDAQIKKVATYVKALKPAQ